MDSSAFGTIAYSVPVPEEENIMVIFLPLASRIMLETI